MMRIYNGPPTVVQLKVATTRRPRLASDSQGPSDRHLPGEQRTVPLEQAQEMVRLGHATIIGPAASDDPKDAA